MILISLFITLGITASEYLCPNLDTIAKFFQLSENLTGVTLLAIGNGSPDVISTLESIKLGSANLAIGELIGAALFITGVVIGSMAIVSPFKVVKRPFVRDSMFLLFGVVITIWILSDGVITVMEGLVMILIYTAYVILVVCWDWITNHQERLRTMDYKIRNQFNPLDEDDPINHLDQELYQDSIVRFEAWLKKSRFKHMRFDESASGLSLETLTPMNRIQISSAPQFRDEVEYEERFHSAPELYHSEESTSPTELKVKKRSITDLLFPSLIGLNGMSVVDKFITVLSLPFVTMLRLTIPVINTDEQIDDSLFNDHWVLLVIHSLISPVVGMSLMFELSLKLFLVSLFISIVSVALIFTIKQSNWLLIILSSIGFIISISWISAIATELIAIIKFFSVLLDLSDSIMGITIFAVGNSLGDFMSNYTIAKMGFPMMAISACFGGPLLNILLGIGGSVLYIVPMTGEHIKVDISGTLIIMMFTLVLNLIGLLVIVPLNQWELNRSIGMCMIGLWCLATTVCVVLEVVS
jgi:sodium/potassium/calcium exchanger 6